MTLEEFNNKYRNGKKDNVYEACQEAVQIMSNSLDDAHDIKHVENIFSLIDLFLTIHTNLQVDYDVLMLAVCWHDAWKAIKGHGNIIDLSYQQLAEGIASSLLFKDKSKKYSLDKMLVKNVCYAIRKHATIQILPHKTTEAKLLDDADKIDARNFERIKNTQLEKRVLSKKLHLKFALIYLEYIDQRINYKEHLPTYYSYKEEFVAYLKAKA